MHQPNQSDLSEDPITSRYRSGALPHDPPHFYSVKETCRILSLGRTTVFGLLKNQVLSRTRHGRRTLVLRESVDNYAFVLMLRKEGGHAASAH